MARLSDYLHTRYEQDFALIKLRPQRRALVLFLVLLLAYPFLASPFLIDLADQVLLASIGALSLMLLTGYAGQISLGHGAFMAIGGYTTAILMTDHGVRDIATIPLAIVVAGAAGVLFGLPAARLSGLYLALATFALAVAIPALIIKFDGFTGGNAGLALFGTP